MSISTLKSTNTARADSHALPFHAVETDCRNATTLKLSEEFRQSRGPRVASWCPKGCSKFCLESDRFHCRLTMIAPIFVPLAEPLVVAFPAVSPVRADHTKAP